MPPKAKADPDSLLSRQSLKAAIWYTVSQIVEEEEVNLGIAASEHFVASLSELVFAQALSLGKDLESFTKHAGRTTVGIEDVKLVARRNEALYELITSSATQHGLSLASLAPKARAKPRAKKEKAMDVDPSEGEEEPVKKKPRARKLVVGAEKKKSTS